MGGRDRQGDRTAVGADGLLVGAEARERRGINEMSLHNAGNCRFHEWGACVIARRILALHNACSLVVFNSLGHSCVGLKVRMGRPGGRTSDVS